MSRNFLESHEFREQVEADAERDERLAEIRDRLRETAIPGFALPTELQREPDFMRLFQSAVLGASDAERRDIENLITLAFIRGKSAGLSTAVEVSQR